MSRTPIFDSDLHEVPKGVVNPPQANLWRLRRWAPNKELKPFIRWFWMAEWDLTGHEPFETTTLPYPAANLTIDDNDATTLYGPTTKLFRRRLTGLGSTLGVLFSPAGLSALSTPLTDKLVDRHCPARTVFIKTPTEFERLTLTRADPNPTIDVFERILDAHRPTTAASKTITVNRIVDSIANNPGLTTVDDVASFHHLSRRTLQRLFTNHVGVGVKAVIRRHRLQEIANLALLNDDIDWATIAAELGYADQSHMIRDFEQTLGISPAKHQKRSSPKIVS